jgi:hypothetical protein
MGCWAKSLRLFPCLGDMAPRACAKWPRGPAWRKGAGSVSNRLWSAELALRRPGGRTPRAGTRGGRAGGAPHSLPSASSAVGGATRGARFVLGSLLRSTWAVRLPPGGRGDRRWRPRGWSPQGKGQRTGERRGRGVRCLVPWTPPAWRATDGTTPAARFFRRTFPALFAAV